MCVMYNNYVYRTNCEYIIQNVYQIVVPQLIKKNNYIYIYIYKLKHHLIFAMQLTHNVS